MAKGFSSSDGDDLLRAEETVRARIGDHDFDFDSLAAVSNVFRVANTAKYHFERSVLGPYELSFTAFTVLWVLWVWGELESRHLAAEAGITKGTLTGVVRTLESRGLVDRRSHTADRRLVLVAASEEGSETMERLFADFNHEETKITEQLTGPEKRDLARHLRTILRTLESSDG